ncbi:hypothetical protein JXA02_01830 [candidate division KSB1 bacterium]|nr:hypothetical protein [candidate division KSB1 bacterium]RQW10688.1 MAG: hypothetical protein EH222_02025 [candidate division KSB1 bacterium]
MEQRQMPFNATAKNHLIGDEEPAENSEYYLKCQLLRLFSGADLPLNIFDKILLKLRRLRSAVDRRIARMKGQDAAKIKVENKNAKGGAMSSKGESLQAGDLVQVLSREEIGRLLNEKNETQGLAFLPEMEKFCGVQARVMRRVNYMFDERARVMRKIKNVVLLEGVICSGEGMFSAEGCDRACFLFWKEAWLKKISD